MGSGVVSYILTGITFCPRSPIFMRLLLCSVTAMSIGWDGHITWCVGLCMEYAGQLSNKYLVSSLH